MDGDWKEIDSRVYQLKCRDRAVVDWFSTTGTLLYQGPVEARDKLKDMLADGPPPILSQFSPGSRAGAAPKDSTEEIRSCTAALCAQAQGQLDERAIWVRRLLPFRGSRRGERIRRFAVEQAGHR